MRTYALQNSNATHWQTLNLGMLAILAAFFWLGLNHPAHAKTPAPAPKAAVIDLTMKNFKSVMAKVNADGLPVLVETCVTAACGLEKDELNAAVQAMDGKVVVLRLNTTKEPKLYSGMLMQIVAVSGDPTQLFIIAQSNARWAMHTLYAPHMVPLKSLFGLETKETILGFAGSYFEPKGSEGHDDQGPEAAPKANAI
jgi:hypothetical protein